MGVFTDQKKPTITQWRDLQRVTKWSQKGPDSCHRFMRNLPVLSSKLPPQLLRFIHIFKQVCHVTRSASGCITCNSTRSTLEVRKMSKRKPIQIGPELYILSFVHYQQQRTTLCQKGYFFFILYLIYFQHIFFIKGCLRKVPLVFGTHGLLVLTGQRNPTQNSLAAKN